MNGKSKLGVIRIGFCFLGMIGYYRRFIQHFSKITSSLTEMLKKGKPNRLQWTEPSVSAFKTL
jgi:hypothetical protein